MFSNRLDSLQQGVLPLRHRYPSCLFNRISMTMILLCPVQNKVPGAQLVLFRDGHGATLAGQVFFHRLLPYFLTVCSSLAFPFSESAEVPSARYRLIQVCMVEWPTPARRTVSCIHIRPARYSWISFSFSDKSISIRFPIPALTRFYCFAVCLLGSIPNCQQLKLKPQKDGKRYLTDVADTEQLLRIIQSIPSPKAEPFKMWLAQVGQERIEEAIDPELTMERALGTYHMIN